MKTADQLLGEERIVRRGSGVSFYTACPKCAADRKKKHTKTLSVTITNEGILFYCFHCPHHGGRFYDEDEHGRGRAGENQRTLGRHPGKAQHQRRDSVTARSLYGPMGR